MNNFFYQRLNAFKLLQADFPLSNETETIYPQSEPNHTHTYTKMHTQTKPKHLVSYHVLVALNKISNAQPNRSQTFIKFDFLCHKAFLLTYLFVIPYARSELATIVCHSSEYSDKNKRCDFFFFFRLSQPYISVVLYKYHLLSSE